MKKHNVIFCLGLLAVMAVSFPVGEAIGRHFSHQESKCMDAETDCIADYSSDKMLSVENYARACVQQRMECEK